MWDVLLAAAAWYLCGVVGFLYWWSEGSRADARAVAEALAFGVLGPVTVFGGWLVHRVLPVEERCELKPIRIRTDEHRRRPRR